MSLTDQSVLDSLRQYADPNTGKGLRFEPCREEPARQTVPTCPSTSAYPAQTQIDTIRQAVIAQVKSVPGVGNVSANVRSGSSPTRCSRA